MRLYLVFFINFVEDITGHDLRYSINVSKIKSELGLYPKIDFINGLKDTIKWDLNNKNY